MCFIEDVCNEDLARFFTELMSRGASFINAFILLALGLLSDLPAHHPEHRLSLSAYSSPNTGSEIWTRRKCVTSQQKEKTWNSVKLTRTHAEWHIPQSWTDHAKARASCKAPHILDITDAAECALHLALVNDAFIDNSNIPLITHQTSRSAEPETWSSLVRECIESWLIAATGQHDISPGAEMAWLMWDDAGVDAVVQKYEPDMYQAFSTLPYPVEKADAFRILVLKWFGGVVS